MIKLMAINSRLWVRNVRFKNSRNINNVLFEISIKSKSFNFVSTQFDPLS